MNSKTKKIVGIGLFTAIVLVLQFLGGSIRFGMFSISLVLVPIVVGAAVYGWQAGAWLGFVFGVAVLLSGDAAAFLAVDVFGTILTVLVKGTAAGFANAASYMFIGLAGTNFLIELATNLFLSPVIVRLISFAKK